MQRIFAQADAARTRGIGWLWRDLQSSRKAETERTDKSLTGGYIVSLVTDQCD